MTDKEYLIGKTFRRNKYGLSTWEDTIVDITTRLHLVNRKMYKPVIQVRGSGHWYDLDEIVIYLK